MAETSRLTDREQQALDERAAADGVSMQDAARQATRNSGARREHRRRVARAADLIMDVHADALERLGG